MQDDRPADRRADTAFLSAGILAAVAHAIGVLAAPALSIDASAALIACYPVPYGMAALLCFGAARRAEWAPERRAWTLFGLGPVVLLVAMGLGFAALRTRHPGVGIASDALALSTYAFTTAGFLALARPRLTSGAWRRSALDLAIVAATVLALAAYVWLRRLETPAGLLHRHDWFYDVLTPAAASMVSVAMAMVLLIGREAHPIGRRLGLVLAATAVMAAADVLITLYHGSWSRYNPLLWTATWLAIGGAAAWRSAGPLGATSDAVPSRATLVRVPYVASLALAALLLLELPQIAVPHQRGLVVGLVLVTVLVIARQVMSLQENRRLAQARLDEAARFTALVQQSIDAFVVCEPYGIVRFHSPVLAPMLGLPAGTSLTGRSLLAYAAAEDREALQDALRAAAAKPATEPVVVGFTTPGGRTVIEAVATNRLHDERIGGLVLNVRDVTDRHRLEVQLQQAQKLEALGRLAGGVAHDFNNLVAAIQGFADLLQEGAAHGEARAEDIEAIRETARRAGALTQQLLAFARRQPTHARPISLDEVVGAMLPIMRQLAGPGVRLEWYPGAAGRMVLADPAQVEQVVLNLVVNARDATAHGGRVVVATGPFAAPDTASSPGVRLTVSDTGIGMDETTRERAFEPFFTTKPDGQGTGLGLATVYGIVTQGGGRVAVESAPGEGTTISVELPAAPDVPSALSPGPARVRAPVA